MVVAAPSVAMLISPARVAVVVLAHAVVEADIQRVDQVRARARTKAAGRTTGWVLVREGQLQSLQLPRTGVAVTVFLHRGRMQREHTCVRQQAQEVGGRLFEIDDQRIRAVALHAQ